MVLSFDDTRLMTEKERKPVWVKKIGRLYLGLFIAESGRWTVDGKLRPLVGRSDIKEANGLAFCVRKYCLMAFWKK